jgi:hypothetical protein
MHSPNPKKMSLHLIIDSPDASGPMLLYNSNLDIKTV